MADEEDYPTPDVPVAAIEPAELLGRVERGDPVRLLDVRAASEFEAWHLDGPSLTVENVPYFAFLDGVTEALLARLPEGEGPLVTVCAKGGASEYVAGLLVEAGVDARNLAEGMVGWGDLYRVSPVERYEGPGRVLQYHRPSSGCLAYLLVSDGEAAVVDPLYAFADRYVADADAAGADLVTVVDTHIHADHVSGLRRLRRETGAEAVLSGPAIARGLEDATEVTAVEDGDALEVGGATIEVIHTPGHTSGMTAYRIGNLLLTGDGLFTESVARPDLEAGDDGAAAAAATLHETLHQRVLPMPAETVVAPAHASDSADPAGDGTYTARLGELRERMAPLSLPQEAFVEFILADMPPRPANFETIIEINLGRRDVEADGVFELEQGPNNCAATREAIAGE